MGMRMEGKEKGKEKKRGRKEMERGLFNCFCVLILATALAFEPSFCIRSDKY